VLEKQVAALRDSLAPDRRTDRVDVQIINRGDSMLLEGYTTLPEAHRRLSALADGQAGTFSRVRLLPSESGHGLVRVSVANIRTEPGHSRELTSQALMGSPVELMDYEDGWFFIRTPDRYLAWLEEGAIVRVDEPTMQSWFSEDLRTCVPAQSAVVAVPNGTRVVSELVAGNLVRASGKQKNGHTEVVLPDDRRGWVPSDHLTGYRAFARPDALEMERVLETAYTLTGRPYLWGGTSTKAMDCSGFTKTAYFLNGYVIPRDASQQVKAGREVELDANLSKLERGDLLFFGNFREDGSERTTHVGFYVGDGRFLHAGADNDFITENSLIKGERDYAAHRRESLLRARRLAAGTDGVETVDRAFRSLYTRSSSR